MIPPPGAKTFTSRESLAHAHRLRREAEAIVTGSGCILADDPAFSVRHVADHPGRRRRLAILDRRGRTPDRYLREAADRGLDATVHADLDALLDALGAEGVLTALVEAGPTLRAAILERRAVGRGGRLPPLGRARRPRTRSRRGGAPHERRNAGPLAARGRFPRGERIVMPPLIPADPAPPPAPVAVEEVARARLPSAHTPHGLVARAFRNLADGVEHLALVKGEPGPGRPGARPLRVPDRRRAGLAALRLRRAAARRPGADRRQRQRRARLCARARGAGHRPRQQDRRLCAAGSRARYAGGQHPAGLPGRRARLRRGRRHPARGGRSGHTLAHQQSAQGAGAARARRAGRRGAAAGARRQSAQRRLPGHQAGQDGPPPARRRPRDGEPRPTRRREPPLSARGRRATCAAAPARGRATGASALPPRAPRTGRRARRPARRAR